jgi:type II secretory pathway component PulF
MKTNNLTISTSDKLGLISNLATMLGSGIPILETVTALNQEAKGNLKKVLDATIHDLNQGHNLSFSFARFPKIFNPVHISILKSSELSGNLISSLKDLRKGIRRDLEFTDKVKSALLYPAILMVVFTLMFTLILFFVIPRIAAIFSNLRVVLPLPTKILISLSNLLTSYPLVILAIILVIVLLSGILFKAKKRQFINFFFSWPLVRSITREIDLTRFSHNLSLLLASGVPITNALDLSREVVINNDIYKAIAQSREAILSGGKLSEGLKGTKRGIPNIMLKIIEAGEKTGTLDKSMEDISEYLDYNVTNNLKSITTTLESVILVVVGIFIGSIMLSIIAPIYNLIGQINAH